MWPWAATCPPRSATRPRTRWGARGGTPPRSHAHAAAHAPAGAPTEPCFAASSPTLPPHALPGPGQRGHHAPPSASWQATTIRRSCLHPPTPPTARAWTTWPSRAPPAAASCQALRSQQSSQQSSLCLHPSNRQGLDNVAIMRPACSCQLPSSALSAVLSAILSLPPPLQPPGPGQRGHHAPGHQVCGGGAARRLHLRGEARGLLLSRCEWPGFAGSALRAWIRQWEGRPPALWCLRACNLSRPCPLHIPPPPAPGPHLACVNASFYLQAAPLPRPPQVLTNAFRAAESIGRPGAAFVSLPQARAWATGGGLGVRRAPSCRRRAPTWCDHRLQQPIVGPPCIHCLSAGRDGGPRQDAGAGAEPAPGRRQRARRDQGRPHHQQRGWVARLRCGRRLPCWAAHIIDTRVCRAAVCRRGLVTRPASVPRRHHSCPPCCLAPTPLAPSVPQPSRSCSAACLPPRPARPWRSGACCAWPPCRWWRHSRWVGQGWRVETALGSAQAPAGRGRHGPWLMAAFPGLGRRGRSRRRAQPAAASHRGAPTAPPLPAPLHIARRTLQGAGCVGRDQVELYGGRVGLVSMLAPLAAGPGAADREACRPPRRPPPLALPRPAVMHLHALLGATPLSTAPSRVTSPPGAQHAGRQAAGQGGRGGRGGLRESPVGGQQLRRPAPHALWATLPATLSALCSTTRICGALPLAAPQLTTPPLLASTSAPVELYCTGPGGARRRPVASTESVAAHQSRLLLSSTLAGPCGVRCGPVERRPRRARHCARRPECVAAGRGVVALHGAACWHAGVQAAAGAASLPRVPSPAQRAASSAEQRARTSAHSHHHSRAPNLHPIHYATKAPAVLDNEYIPAVELVGHIGNSLRALAAQLKVCVCALQGVVPGRRRPVGPWAAQAGWGWRPRVHTLHAHALPAPSNESHNAGPRRRRGQRDVQADCGRARRHRAGARGGGGGGGGTRRIPAPLGLGSPSGMPGLVRGGADARRPDAALHLCRRRAPRTPATRAARCTRCGWWPTCRWGGRTAGWVGGVRPAGEARAPGPARVDRSLPGGGPQAPCSKHPPVLHLP